MGSRLLKLYDKYILGHPFIALIITLAIVGFFAYHITEFKLDASADTLMLENDKDLRYFRKVIERYGTNDYLFLAYTPKSDLLSEESLNTLKNLRDDIKNIPGVKSVVSILDVPLLFSPPVPLNKVEENMKTLEDSDVDKDLARAEFKENPLYRRRLVSLDGQTTALLINLTPDLKGRELVKRRSELRQKKYEGMLSPEEAQELERVSEQYKEHSAKMMKEQDKTVEAVRAVMDHYRDKATLFLGGVAMIVTDMIAFIKNDLVIFSVGVFLFLIITLSIIFRKPRWVIIPLLCCLAAAVTMMGYLGLMDWRVTVISSNFISLMLILTMSMTIHLVVYYRELYANHPDMDNRTMVRETVRFKVMPCLYAALTTIVAFTSLLVSGIRPVIDFGKMMTIGLMVTFLLSFLIFPTTLMLLKKTKPPTNVKFDTPFTLIFARLTEAHGKKILFISLVLGVLSVVGISGLKVENRFIDYFKKTTEIYQGMIVIDKKLGGTTPLDIIIDFKDEKTAPEQSSSEEDPFAEDPFAEEDKGSQDRYWFTAYKMERIEKIHDFISSLPETGEVLSIATLMKVVTRLNDNKPLDNYELALMYTWLPEEIKKILVYPYASIKDNETRITLRVIESDKSLQRQVLLEKIKTFLTNKMDFDEEQIHFSNVYVLYNNMLQSLFKSQILTIGVVFLCIMIMFVILFRSFFLAVIAIIPNILPAIMVLGTMGWLNIPLDMMTITIAAITIGIAVDNTIHYIHRFQDEFPKDRNYKDTMYRCHRSIGRAMYYTSLTIIIGFSILVMSNFIPTVYFGIFTGLAMFAALIAALTLLPQLIIFLKPLGQPEKT
jgi:predicted RND superfamily exporter protein